jgi:cytochrome b561
MALRGTRRQWGAVAKAFHWAVAILIAVETYLVWYIVNQDFENFREQSTATFRAIMPWHKALGFLILVLIGLRLVWRRSDPRPALPDSMKRWEHSAAIGTHHSLYILTAASILTGWARVSANGSPANVFEWFVLPPLAPKDEQIRLVFEVLHDWTSWGLVALAVFHAAAGIKHHFIDRDHFLKSMLPFAKVE